jgi:hypothetical protein
MKTEYLPLKKIPADDLFDGHLEKFSIREDRIDKATLTERWLTDGQISISVDINDAGFAYCFTGYSDGDPSKILNAIADAFDTDIVEEWNAYSEAKDDEFYVELMKFLRGEANLGSINMKYAEVAKALVEKDPTLMLLENKRRLLDETASTYQRDYSVTVTLSAENVAILKRSMPLPSETYLMPSRNRRVRLHRYDCDDDPPSA